MCVPRMPCEVRHHYACRSVSDENSRPGAACAECMTYAEEEPGEAAVAVLGGEYVLGSRVEEADFVERNVLLFQEVHYALAMCEARCRLYAAPRE